jgi:hypothetical protein
MCVFVCDLACLSICQIQMNSPCFCTNIHFVSVCVHIHHTCLCVRICARACVCRYRYTHSNVCRSNELCFLVPGLRERICLYGSNYVCVCACVYILRVDTYACVNTRYVCIYMHTYAHTFTCTQIQENHYIYYVQHTIIKPCIFTCMQAARGHRISQILPMPL